METVNGKKQLLGHCYVAPEQCFHTQQDPQWIELFKGNPEVCLTLSVSVSVCRMCVCLSVFLSLSLSPSLSLWGLVCKTLNHHLLTSLRKLQGTCCPDVRAVCTQQDPQWIELFKGNPEVCPSLSLFLSLSLPFKL